MKVQNVANPGSRGAAGPPMLLARLRFVAR
jgi:hypothetical protein